MPSDQIGHDRTNYALKSGNPLFMSPTTAETPKQPAQHWEFSSIGVVDDGVYSTSVTPVSSTSPGHFD